MTSPRIVLATSNGHGMGHLTRQLAVALELQGRAEPLVFSLSLAMPVVAAHGLVGEYCPSHDRGWMPHVSWHRYLRDRVVEFVEETGADVLLFDGVSPYLGLLQARSRLPRTAFVWSRRGMWVPGFNDRALSATPFFDLVVEPGDLGSAGDTGPTVDRGDAVQVGPISLLDAVPPLPRDVAAAELGLDPSRTTVLVTLGSGVLGEAAAPGEVAIRTLLEETDWQVVVTKAAIAREGLPLVDAERVVELRSVYPLVRYLSAFDAAVSAAGYNAVHEFLPAGLPTLIVPNPTRSTDDQRARAQAVAARGLALYADPGDPEGVAAGVRSLADTGVRVDLARACLSLARTAPMTGAADTAQLLVSLAGAFDRHRPGPLERVRTAELAARAGVMDVIGPDRTAAVRRALGRTPPSGPSRPLRVRLVEEPAGIPVDAPPPPWDPSGEGSEVIEPLLVTERVSSALVHRGTPLEQLIPGSSARYRARRLALARRAYDVTA